MVTESNIVEVTEIDDLRRVGSCRSSYGLLTTGVGSVKRGENLQIWKVTDVVNTP